MPETSKKVESWFLMPMIQYLRDNPEKLAQIGFVYCNNSVLGVGMLQATSITLEHADTPRDHWEQCNKLIEKWETGDTSWQ